MSVLAERMTGHEIEPWIGVDFDGTLAETPTGKYDSEKCGSPVKPMLDRVRKWVKDGKRIDGKLVKKVKIFTARADDEKAVTAIKKWLQKHDLPALEVTNLKDPGMMEFWDDKAVAVEKDTGEVVDETAVYIVGQLLA